MNILKHFLIFITLISFFTITACSGGTGTKEPSGSPESSNPAEEHPVNENGPDPENDQIDEDENVGRIIDEAEGLTDIDADGINDIADNCLNIPNPKQEDMDQDGLGDLCDLDKDGDNVTSVNDCDDTNSAIYPNAQETCGDGLDNNCNEEIDEQCICGNGETQPCGSSTGLCIKGTQECVNNAWGACTGAIMPVAEICDNQDNNCDGIIDNGETDNDNDGIYTICNDNCPDIANVDQLDTDNDGKGDACDSCINDPANDIDNDTVCADVDNCPLLANPNQENLDNDALGDICDPDQDNDNFIAANDCNDRDPNINPDANEICFDGIDNNCNNFPDEFCECVNDEIQECGVEIGLCRKGTQRCSLNQWNDCIGDIKPVDEICNGLDDNCNGIVDDVGHNIDGDNLYSECGDNCPNIANPDQADIDQDGIGNACDNDFVDLRNVELNESQGELAIKSKEIINIFLKQPNIAMMNAFANDFLVPTLSQIASSIPQNCYIGGSQLTHIDSCLLKESANYKACLENCNNPKTCQAIGSGLRTIRCTQNNTTLQSDKVTIHDFKLELSLNVRNYTNISSIFDLDAIERLKNAENANAVIGAFMGSLLWQNVLEISFTFKPESPVRPLQLQITLPEDHNFLLFVPVASITYSGTASGMPWLTLPVVHQENGSAIVNEYQIEIPDDMLFKINTNNIVNATAVINGNPEQISILTHDVDINYGHSLWTYGILDDRFVAGDGLTITISKNPIFIRYHDQNKVYACKGTLQYNVPDRWSANFQNLHCVDVDLVR